MTSSNVVPFHTNFWNTEDEHRKELLRRFSTQPSVDETVSDVTGDVKSDKTSVRHRRRRSTRATSVISDKSMKSISRQKSVAREEPLELIKREAEGQGNVSDVMKLMSRFFLFFATF